MTSVFHRICGAVPRALPAAGVAVALAAGVAQAQVSAAQLGAVKSNCRAEDMANCMSVSPGGAEGLKCLQSHLDKLAGACKSAVAATMAKPKPAAAAAPPAKPPTAPPPPKVVATPPPAAPAPPAVPHPKPARTATQPTTATAKKTAAPQPARVAPPSEPTAPQPAIATAKIDSLRLPQKIAIFRACHVDEEAICPSVRPGSGRVIDCLAQHPGALSPGCRREMLNALR